MSIPTSNEVPFINNPEPVPNEIPPAQYLTPTAPQYDLPPTEPPHWSTAQFAETPISMAKIRSLGVIQNVFPSYSYRGWDADEWVKQMTTAREEAGPDVWNDPGVCGLRLLAARTTSTAGLEGVAIQKEKTGTRTARRCIAIERRNIMTRPVIETPPIPKNFADFTALYVHSTDGLELVRKLTLGRWAGGGARRKVAYLTAGSIEPMGGGWERGRFGIEEDLFYRTNMCYAKCAGEKVMVLYTSDVTLFRNSELYGFTFLESGEQAVFDAISIALPNLAARHSSIQRGLLENEDTARLRRNLAMVFAEAIRNKIDALVLTPLGCDHRLCPPDTVAATIRAVAEQFAGFIPEVHVVISPELFSNNVRDAFTKALGVASGEWASLRVMARDQPGMFIRQKCCINLGVCRESVDSNPAHFTTFYHPPTCPNGGACKVDYPYHNILFAHPGVAPRDAKRAQGPGQEGQNKAMPLPFCQDPFVCPFVCKPPKMLTSGDKAHIMTCRHFCQFGMQCPAINEPGHRRFFAHIETRDECRDGKSCKKINDVAHRLSFIHKGVKCFPVKCFSGDDCRFAAEFTHSIDFYHKDEPKGIKKCYNLKWLEKQKINYF